jgi:hypothetical protein
VRTESDPVREEVLADSVHENEVVTDPEVVDRVIVSLIEVLLDNELDDVLVGFAPVASKPVKHTVSNAILTVRRCI